MTNQTPGSADERPITKEEYLAWLRWRLPRMAEELTATLLPQDARDAGMRFEWVSDDGASRD